jgi:hypothetical protein
MEFLDETVMLATMLFDQASRSCRFEEGQVLTYASACFFIASKLEETLIPCVADFAAACEWQCSTSEILECESRILRALEFHLPLTSPLTHTHTFQTTAGPKMIDLARFFCYVFLFSQSFYETEPAVIGVASVLLAGLMLDLPPKVQEWEREKTAVMACVAEAIAILGRCSEFERLLQLELPAFAHGTIAELVESLAEKGIEEKIGQCFSQK